MSTSIIYSYLKHGIPNLVFLDARELIVTDRTYQDASVNWEQTTRIIQSVFDESKNHIVITQGFIGADQDVNSTSLGREGSDFTGAIFAAILDADSFTVWKDVDGIRNADPKLIPDAMKFEELSYEEATEMLFYGAKVIHPKTIKSLANAGIPLYVKLFLSPQDIDTVIRNVHIMKSQPAIIFKENQTLLSFRVEDFTFIQQQHLTHIIEIITRIKIHVNRMQNSAISFSVCVDSNPLKIEEILESLGKKYSILYNDELLFIIIKNYDLKTIYSISENREILLEQRSRHNYQIVVRPKIASLRTYSSRLNTQSLNA